MANRCTYIPQIMLPKAGCDLSKWAVIACDQYTSQPEYWAETDHIVGDAPSTLRLTLPEVYLEGADVAARTEKIHETMRRYMADGTLRTLSAGVVLTERWSGGTCPRRGIVLAVDLEAYEYTPGSASLIRPTEKTVVERIPPRLKVRQGACMELPHIMILIDDPDRRIIEPLFDKTDSFEKVYDTDLMQGGGHITGWFIPKGAETDAIEDGLEALCDRDTFNKKYGCTDAQALLPYAQNIARELDVMKRNVGAMADADSVLRISAISFLSYYGVTARIASYINENPNAAVGIKEMSSDLGLSLLQDGRVDAVMMFHAGPLGGAYDIYPMAEEEMVAIMNKDHVLSDREAVTLGDLESQELILISEHDEPFFHDFVVGELKREGYRPRLHKYRVWIGAIETILKQSQSVALLPRKVAERMNGGGVVYKNIEGLPAFSFSVVTKMNNNKPVFRDFIRYLEG